MPSAHRSVPSYADLTPSRQRSLTVLVGLAAVVGLALATALWGAVGLVVATAALFLAGAAGWLVCLAAESAAARAAARARREFLDGMSHELRTPLNSVIGFSNVLLRTEGGRLSPNERQYLERVRSSGEHLLGVVEELLARAEGPAVTGVESADRRERAVGRP